MEDALRAAHAGEITDLTTGNHFESSRLLFFDEWRAAATRLGHRILVAVPESDSFLIAIDPSGEQVQKLRKVAADRYATAQRPVSGRVFEWQGTHWSPIP